MLLIDGRSSKSISWEFINVTVGICSIWKVAGAIAKCVEWRVIQRRRELMCSWLGVHLGHIKQTLCSLIHHTHLISEISLRVSFTLWVKSRDERGEFYVFLPGSGNVKLWTNWDVLLKSSDLSNAIFPPLWKCSVLVWSEGGCQALGKETWLWQLLACWLQWQYIRSTLPVASKQNGSINHRRWSC